ncbi:MAG: DNA replication and repair protein RecF [Verrucomicrobiota bacterium]|nr:DNA replication and repair protein RecF [Verrucomicrobiota bacterium]
MLTSLKLRDFRCFESAVIDFAPDFNFFLGANGQGKTSVLEAACLLLRLQSQRTSTIAPAIRIGAKSFALRGQYDGHDLEFRYRPLRRSVKFDDAEQRALGEYLQLARVVSFANADIELVRGSSEARRRYLDFLGLQIDATYRTVLRSYERALRARNAILKSLAPRPRERAAYDSLLLEHGAKLLARRAKISGALAPLAAAAYSRISGAREKFALSFLPGASENFAADLDASHTQETRLRQTMVGPHRDDLDLRVDEMSAAQFASEGQQRSIALALKLAQAEVLRAAGAAAPLLLLDDIFGELDETRRNALIDHLPAGSQKLVTATAMPWRKEMPAGAIFRLRERQLIAG